MRQLAFILFMVTSALAGDQEQVGKFDFWRHKLEFNKSAVKCHPDTLELFLAAPDCLPADDSTGLPILGTMTKKIHPDGLKGWLWIVERAADVRTQGIKPNGHHYWSYVIRPVFIFDLTKDNAQKK